jgi:hypothetical protein
MVDDEAMFFAFPGSLGIKIFGDLFFEMKKIKRGQSIRCDVEVYEVDVER